MLTLIQGSLMQAHGFAEYSVTDHYADSTATVRFASKFGLLRKIRSRILIHSS
jgi:hypothetical protein